MHRSIDPPPRGRTRLRWLLPAAAVAVVLIAIGGALLTRRPHHEVHTGVVPTSERPTVPSSVPPPVTRFTDAPTLAVTGLSGQPEAQGPAAPTALSPSGTNVLPIHVVRLRIPAQQVDAPVVDVGVGANGLDIPADPKVLGRWDGGANPGEPYGSVVVAGHVDNTHEVGALFHLSQLPVGATVVAVGSDGRSLTYRITGVREVPKLNLAGLDVFAQTTEPRLVLITCGGSFDRSTHSYADNIVAFGVPT